MADVFEYVLSERPEIAELLPEEYTTVLEIGCAKGGFRRSLKPLAEVWGIEPNAQAAAQASNAGYKILVGIYERVCDQCPDNYFDLIICNDVIEHMIDHDKFLDEIKKKLKKDGRLVGSIPNVRYFGNLFKLLVKKDWKYEDQGVLDRTHLRFFTEKSLTNTFTAHDYSIEKLVGVNSDLTKKKTLRQILKNALLLMTILLSLGSLRDTQYIQLAFRIKLRH